MAKTVLVPEHVKNVLDRIDDCLAEILHTSVEFESLITPFSAFGTGVGGTGAKYALAQLTEVFQTTTLQLIADAHVLQGKVFEGSRNLRDATQQLGDQIQNLPENNRIA